MKKRKISKSNLITVGIILVIVIIVILASNKPVPATTKEIVKCIGEKATLYTQLGCHACETQEELFGENYQYLNIIDCFYEREQCSGIEATPTWKINNQLYRGVQSISKLQEITKC
jgi:hypothetical protein